MRVIYCILCCLCFSAPASTKEPNEFIDFAFDFCFIPIVSGAPIITNRMIEVTADEIGRTPKTIDGLSPTRYYQDLVTGYVVASQMIVADMFRSCQVIALEKIEVHEDLDQFLARIGQANTVVPDDCIAIDQEEENRWLTLGATRHKNLRGQFVFAAFSQSLDDDTIELIVWEAPKATITDLCEG
ncbi:MAG: hypothetical protein AAF386_03115 [Pseudomonadota bacterium]